jgi:hypothetical protein
MTKIIAIPTQGIEPVSLYKMLSAFRFSATPKPLEIKHWAEPLNNNSHIILSPGRALPLEKNGHSIEEECAHRGYNAVILGSYIELTEQMIHDLNHSRTRKDEVIAVPTWGLHGHEDEFISLLQKANFNFQGLDPQTIKSWINREPRPHYLYLGKPDAGFAIVPGDSESSVTRTFNEKGFENSASYGAPVVVLRVYSQVGPHVYAAQRNTEHSEITVSLQ